MHVVNARREKLAQLLREHRYLPINELCRLLDVSEATARRDLAALEQGRKLTRTYGGAIAEFNERFPSFNERCALDAGSKSKLATAALSLLEPNGTYFFDSGSTVFVIAKALSRNPVGPMQVVTCNLPVGELLSEVQGIEVFQIAGQLLKRQSILLGETARRSLDFWRFDMAFLSAEGMDAEGVWNSEASIVEQQRAVLRRSAQTAFLLGRSKLARRAPHFLLPWPQVDLLISDATGAEIERAGIKPRQYLEATGKTPAKAPEQTAGDGLPVHFL